MRVKHRDDPLFLISFYMYLFFGFTYYMRTLPVMYFQLPYMAVCLFFLCVATYNKKGRYVDTLIVISILIIGFNYLFVYLQSDVGSYSLITSFGVNFKLFLALYPLLILISQCLDRNNIVFLKNVFICVLVFTSITTIIGTYKYEAPCRFLAAMKDAELTTLYQSHNIGGYTFIYSLVLFIPVLLSELNKKFRIHVFLVLCLFLFCIVRSEYTTALLLSFLGITIGLVLIVKNVYLRIAIGLVGLLFIGCFEQLLVWAIDFFQNISFDLTYRLESVLQYYLTDSLTGDLLGRTQDYMLSINNFINNPFFGAFFKSGVHGGEHSEILDLIGHSGLVGLSVLILIIFKIRLFFVSIGIKRDRFLVLVFFLALLLALINTFSATELFFCILVVPVLFFSKETDIEPKKLSTSRGER